MGKLPRPAAQGEAEGHDVTPRPPRPKKGALKAARAVAHHESKTAADAVPSPRPGTHRHKMWKMLGLPDRPQQQLPRTREEAEQQKVTPGARARDAQKAYISAARAEARGRVRGAGRIKGEDSKETRANYARWIAKFIRSKQPGLLMGPPIRKAAIRRFLHECSTKADHLPKWPGPRNLDDIGTPAGDAWLAARKLYGAAFIKFLQLEQSWVRKQIAKA